MDKTDKYYVMMDNFQWQVIKGRIVQPERGVYKITGETVARKIYGIALVKMFEKPMPITALIDGFDRKVLPVQKNWARIINL